jgi:hypothetical protein
LKPAEPPWLNYLERMPRPWNRLPNPARNFPAQILTDPVRIKALALRRRCPTCACPLPRNRPVYRQFPRVTLGSGVFTATGLPPQHWSCAVYARLVCPWLSHPLGRGRKSGVLRASDVRISGFSRDGVMLTADMITGEQPFLTYAYVEPVDAIPFDSWRDLLEAYEQSLGDDIDTTTRLHWGPEDEDRLAADAQQDEMMLGLDC